MRWSMKRLTRLQRRILVEIRWRLGDEIMAIPIYEALREQWPQSHIAVLCNHPDLLAGNPHVDAVNATTGRARSLYSAPRRGAHGLSHRAIRPCRPREDAH